MTVRTPLKSIPRAITSVLTSTQLSPFRILETASSRSFRVNPACKQSTFGTSLSISCSASDVARGCVDVKITRGGSYGCDKYVSSVGSLDESSATYFSSWEIDGSGVSLDQTRWDTEMNKKPHKTYLSPTTIRTGSSIKPIASFSAPAGRVALKTVFCRDGWVHAARISSVCDRNSLSSSRSASSRTICRTLPQVLVSERTWMSLHAYLSSWIVLFCNDATSLSGVLTITSVRC